MEKSSRFVSVTSTANPHDGLVLLQNVVTDPESQACSIIPFCREEWFREPLNRLLVHSVARVDYCDANAGLVRRRISGVASAQINNSAPTYCAEGVSNQIPEALPQF
jgi:hypothetical protein